MTAMCRDTRLLLPFLNELGYNKKDKPSFPLMVRFLPTGEAAATSGKKVQEA